MFLPLSCAHLDLVFVAQSATPVDQYHSQAYRSTDFFVDAWAHFNWASFTTLYILAHIDTRNHDIIVGNSSFFIAADI